MRKNSHYIIIGVHQETKKIEYKRVRNRTRRKKKAEFESVASVIYFRTLISRSGREKYYIFKSPKLPNDCCQIL